MRQDADVRRWRQLGLALGASVTIACGGGGGAARLPDAGIPDAAMADAPDPIDITIKVYPDGFPYRGRTANAELVAFQDGDGSWTALTGSGGVYHARVTGQRYAVATGCVASPARNLTLYYQALSDTKEVHADGCSDATGLVHVKVDLQGAPAGDVIEVRFARRKAVGSAGSVLEFDVPKGMVEPFARSYPPGDVETDRAYIAPTVDLQADQTLTYDFGGLGKPIESHPLTVTGLEADETVIVNSTYATSNSQGQYPLLTQLFTGAPDTYVTLDATLRKPADISNVLVLAIRTDAGLDHGRYVRSAFQSVEARTVALPASFAAPPPAVVDAATSRTTLTIPAAAPVLGNVEYTASFSTTRSSDSALRGLGLRVRPGWVGAASSVTVATPDLSGLPGWSADMGLFSGEGVSWLLERADYNLDPDALPADGRHILGVNVAGVIAPDLAAH
jgi:hypothetical protein